MSHVVLDHLLAEVASSPTRPVVVFDVDDTLLATANRQLRILREFADTIAATHPDAARALRGVQKGRLRYAVSDTAMDHGIEPVMAGQIRDFWFDRFFTNPYLSEDAMVPGAAEYVRAVVDAGGLPVYLTGRDETMREGTEASLEHYGFPTPDGRQARLVLKPKFETPDFAFKHEAASALRELGRVLGTFENEPAHVNLFAEHYPEARHFLLETAHSGRPIEPVPATHRIRDFTRHH